MKKLLFSTIKYGAVVGLGLGALAHVSFAAPVLTPATVTEIGSTSAIIKARVSNTGMYTATVWFEWGETSSLEKSVIGMEDFAGGGYFDYSITGLKENTTYYFRAVAMDSDGEITRSSTTTFTTGDTVSVSDSVAVAEKVESAASTVAVPTIVVKKSEEKSSTKEETSTKTEKTATATTSNANTASLIGAGSGVFPQSLVGWIALFIVILISVLIVHIIYDTNKKRKKALEKAQQEAKIKAEMQE